MRAVGDRAQQIVQRFTFDDIHRMAAAALHFNHALDQNAFEQKLVARVTAVFFIRECHIRQHQSYTESITRLIVLWQVGFFCGGEGGIRTLEGLRLTALAKLYDRPL